jgi:hypothetical protein
MDSELAATSADFTPFVKKDKRYGGRKRGEKANMPPIEMRSTRALRREFCFDRHETERERERERE